MIRTTVATEQTDCTRSTLYVYHGTCMRWRASVEGQVAVRRQQAPTTPASQIDPSNPRNQKNQSWAWCRRGIGTTVCTQLCYPKTCTVHVHRSTLVLAQRTCSGMRRKTKQDTPCKPPIHHDEITASLCVHPTCSKEHGQRAPTHHEQGSNANGKSVEQRPEKAKKLLYSHALI